MPTWAARMNAGADEEIHARWLIGCDGVRSQVRKSLSIPFEGTTAPQEFLLADMDLDWHRTRETTHDWLTRDGLFAVFPLPGGQWRLFATVMADSSLGGKEVPQASLEVFQRLLEQYTGDTKTSMSNLTWASNFRISYRMARHLPQGPGLSGWRCGPCSQSLRWSGHEYWDPGCL